MMAIFIATYVNFDHRKRDMYWPYSNVQPFKDFRKSLAEHFKIRRFFPDLVSLESLGAQPQVHQGG